MLVDNRRRDLMVAALIVALDMPNAGEAKALVERLGDA